MRAMTVILVVAVQVVPISAMLAQTLPRVEPGDTVRLTVPRMGTTRLVGPVLESDSLCIKLIVEDGPGQIRGDTLEIPRSWITKLDVLSPRVRLGDRVRVSQCWHRLLSSGVQISECERTEGSLISITADAVGIRGDDGVVWSVSPDSISHLDLYQGGSSSYRRLGAALGFLVGAGIGIVIGATACDYDGCEVAGGVLGGLVGALFGVGLGGEIERDHWEEVPLDRLPVSFVAERDGRLAFGVLLTF